MFCQMLSQFLSYIIFNRLSSTKFIMEEDNPFHCFTLSSDSSYNSFDFTFSKVLSCGDDDNHVVDTNTKTVSSKAVTSKVDGDLLVDTSKNTVNSKEVPS